MNPFCLFVLFCWSLCCCFWVHRFLFLKRLFERFLFDWVPFTTGRSVLFKAMIQGGPSGASSFDLGSATVTWQQLISANQGIVSVSLPGGSIGLRLVQPNLLMNATAAPTINLGLLDALVNNVGSNMVTFPQMSFTCMSSSAGWPEGTAPFSDRFVASASLSGAVTTWSKQQVVNRLVTFWDPARIGTILVCTVIELDSQNSAFYRTPDLSLEPISVDATRFVSQSSSFGLSFQNNAFSVTVGSCTVSTCDLSSGAASMASSAFAVIALVTLAVLLF
jgi:hypothetical protein